MTLRNENVFAGIERNGLNEPVATTLEIGHAGSSLAFAFGGESDGAKRLSDFMDILFTKRRDTVFVVDELDRSLYPMLMAQIVKLFADVYANDRYQLVFTTHENDTMADELFRRDEVWLVDRSEDGTPVLYPPFFDSFNLRSDVRMGKQYLEGRYGGVPILSTTRALSAIEGNR
ncbi:MAG: AAA family ATPase [Slackia piriformis]|nr:AAA family ATPase [Slackia piriformis]MDO5023361.1 AAA family ATPase [Slackia piriformis]